MGILYTHGHLLLLVFELRVEVSQVPNHQKQALVNAFYMSAPSPCYVTQTPQREFATAKLQKNIDVGKF